MVTTLVNSGTKSTAPPHRVRASRQEQPSELADGRARSQLFMHRSTERNDYHPCKAPTPHRCRNSTSCRVTVETWRMHQCLFQRRVKPSQCTRSCLSCNMLSSVWKSPTLRSSSTIDANIRRGVSIFHRRAKCRRSFCSSAPIKKMRYRGVVCVQNGSTC